jgi:hypothetical protein
MTAQGAIGVPVLAVGILLVLWASTASAEDQAPPSKPQPAPEAASSSPSAEAARPMNRDRRVSTEDRIEQRVRMMATALNLSATQQGQLRSLLMEQRSQVLRIRSDPSMAPDDRMGALRALNERTTERIRAMLDQEQRNKYSPPPSPTQPAQGDEAPARGSTDAAKSPPSSNRLHE